MSNIEFADLPPDGRTTRVVGSAAMTDRPWDPYYAARVALRENPDAWARIAVGRSAASATAMRRRAAWRGYEIRLRKSEEAPGRWDLWARYVGLEGG